MRSNRRNTAKYLSEEVFYTSMNLCRIHLLLHRIVHAISTSFVFVADETRKRTRPSIQPIKSEEYLPNACFDQTMNQYRVQKYFGIISLLACLFISINTRFWCRSCWLKERSVLRDSCCWRLVTSLKRPCRASKDEELFCLLVWP